MIALEIARQKLAGNERIIPPHAPGMRIGLFGGTFDPPHQAHLDASLLAMKRLKLDRVWWLVTPGNPLKNTSHLAPLGERIRVGGQRYTVIGVMESKGTMFGFDLDDAVYIPVAKSLELFNREGLFEIDVMYEKGTPVDEVVESIRRVLIARHGGEDFTITTQQQMLDVLGSVLNVVTFAVGALGGISLLVGGVGIFTIMTIAVRERTAEIGLLQAIGARRRQIRDVFLGESLLLAGIGGIGGVLLGLACIALLGVLVPALPVSPAWPYMGLAVIVALLIGLIAGVLPAVRAARLDPVDSLRAE